MKESTSKLLQEYTSSTGNSIEFENVESAKAFLDWYKKRKILREEFREFLNYNGFDINRQSCLEIGTTIYNTMALPYQTSILTECPELFKLHLNKKVLYGSLLVKDNKLYFVNKEGDKINYTPVNKRTFNNFLMHNVLDEKTIAGWEKIHNLKQGNIILGAFGNTYDKDRIYKLTMLKALREKLTDYDYLEDYFTVNDMYFYVLGSSTGIYKVY